MGKAQPEGFKENNPTNTTRALFLCPLLETFRGGKFWGILQGEGNNVAIFFLQIMWDYAVTMQECVESYEKNAE